MLEFIIFYGWLLLVYGLPAIAAILFARAAVHRLCAEKEEWFLMRKSEDRMILFAVLWGIMLVIEVWDTYAHYVKYLGWREWIYTLIWILMSVLPAVLAGTVVWCVSERRKLRSADTFDIEIRAKHKKRFRLVLCAGSILFLAGLVLLIGLLQYLMNVYWYFIE